MAVNVYYFFLFEAKIGKFLTNAKIVVKFNTNYRFYSKIPIKYIKYYKCSGINAQNSSSSSSSSSSSIRLFWTIIFTCYDLEPVNWGNP